MNKNAWTKERLESYVGQPEGYQLEFKSSRPLAEGKSEADRDTFVSDLTSHVSAFLNSEGGILVIGIEEARNDNKGKKADIAGGLSAGVPRTTCSPSQLESAICDRLHPSVAGYVRVSPVVVGSSEDGQDLLAYVVEVKQGVTAYQADDKWYYSRRSFSSQPMEDKDIRLRMLADDKPRGRIHLGYDVMPVGTTWDALAVEREAHSHMFREMHKAAALRGTTPAERDIALWAVQGRVKPSRFMLEIVVSLENVGVATIHKGAVALRFESDMNTLPFAVRDVLEPFDYWDSDKPSIYPEMRAEICRHTLEIPVEAALEPGQSFLRTTVYLDGGLAVRDVADLADILGHANAVFSQRWESSRTQLPAQTHS